MEIHKGRPNIIQLRLTGALGLILLLMGILGGELPEKGKRDRPGAHPCVGPRSRRPSGALRTAAARPGLQ